MFQRDGSTAVHDIPGKHLQGLKIKAPRSLPFPKRTVDQLMDLPPDLLNDRSRGFFSGVSFFDSFPLSTSSSL